jgi:DNA repair protein RadC
MTETSTPAAAATTEAALPADTSPPDRDLLAAMIGGNGHGHQLADQLLLRFGSSAALARAHPAELTIMDGIGQATATRLVSAFQLARRAIAEPPPVKLTGDSDTVAAVAPLLRGRTRERLVAVICNRALRVIGCEVMSDGSATRAMLPVREILVAVLRRDGQAFALAHNHPSGDLTPSPNDIEATVEVKRAAEPTGLRFLGHVVVTETSWQAVPSSYVAAYRLRTEQATTS